MRLQNILQHSACIPFAMGTWRSFKLDVRCVRDRIRIIIFLCIRACAANLSSSEGSQWDHVERATSTTWDYTSYIIRFDHDSTITAWLYYPKRCWVGSQDTLVIVCITKISLNTKHRFVLNKIVNIFRTPMYT